MNIDVAPYTLSGVPVLAIAGEIDVHTVPVFRDALHSFARSGESYLVVDLGQVTFMDCSGLGALVGARRRLPDGAQVGVVCARPTITKIFDITGLRHAFPIFTTLEAALGPRSNGHLPPPWLSHELRDQ